MKATTIIIALMVMASGLFAQVTGKTKLTVLNIDAQGVNYDAVQLGNIVRLEADKLGTFEVLDRYDVAYLIEKNELKIDNCYGKICLLEVGKLIKSDKMLTGSAERFGKTIILTFRLIDVKSETIEKTTVKEFLDLQNEMPMMVNITIREMFGLENDPEVLKVLTQKNNLDNSITMPYETRLNLSGPRMGAAFLTGTAAEVFQAPKSKGGYDALPVLFQFGYQFEVQYLNEGNVQGLFEFIPLVSGLEQGLFIPSLTLLHGLRNNRNGLEFAFGPTLSFARMAEGYYLDNEWYTVQQWYDNNTTPIPYELEERLDSRGDVKWSPGFVLAAGFTLKSGKLNIPLNAYVIPRRDNIRVGISMGFNSRR